MAKNLLTQKVQLKYDNKTELGFLCCRGLLCSLCGRLFCFNFSNNGINFSFLELVQPMLFCHHSNFYVLPSALNDLIDKIIKHTTGKKTPIKTKLQ